MHFSGSVISTGEWPFWLSLSLESWSRFLGQAFTQRPQPLQSSSLKVSFAKIVAPPLC
jgi:hypothetical protein